MLSGVVHCVVTTNYYQLFCAYNINRPESSFYLFKLLDTTETSVATGHEYHFNIKIILQIQLSKNLNIKRTKYYFE